LDYKKLSYKGLNTKDFWDLLKIIKAGGKEAVTALGNADTDEQRAMVIIDVGLDHAEKDFKGFLANHAVKENGETLSVQEYDEGPFDLSLTILEKLQEESNLADFFKRAANLVKKFTAKE
jgi:hypothetical protein